jgi:hypothetical protein
MATVLDTSSRRIQSEASRRSLYTGGKNRSDTSHHRKYPRARPALSLCNTVIVVVIDGYPAAVTSLRHNTASPIIVDQNKSHDNH